MSAYYRASEDGDIGEWVRRWLDKAVEDWSDVRLVFDDDTGDYERAEAAARAHIQAEGYYHIYEYWYDGCNFSDEDYIKGRPIPEDGGRRGGTCWASGVWQFEETEPAAAPAAAPEEVIDVESESEPEPAAAAPAPRTPRSPERTEAAARAAAAAIARAEGGGSVLPAEPAVQPPEPDMCVVCMERHAETLVLPCGHSVACRECSRGLAGTANAHLCIVCRGQIDEIVMDACEASA